MRVNRAIQESYALWLEKAVDDADVVEELRRMASDEPRIEDAFYRDLAFGTGGLRGVIGAGTNRMNIYTVGKASQGLANYLKKQTAAPAVVIGYDSRLKSETFAVVAAGVLAANGVHVHIWPTLTPVPTVSFAVRRLGASAGVMITASHNPAQYNGYKVYGADGCQITNDAASAILAEIERLDVFDDVQKMPLDEAMAAGRAAYIADAVMTDFVTEVKRQSVLFGELARRDAAIVYSPLNGAGYVPVTRVLREAGYSHVTVVEEQRLPDGHFPTCPYPNPETSEAMTLALDYAKRHEAELVLATDPDCDRVGVAVRDAAGNYVLLSGNQVGVLLLDYICSQRQKHGKMPADPVMIKTIVTTDMGERIAAHYGVKTVNLLTGFKFIGEQIGKLEKAGMIDRYIFGFEESCGYLSGGYVRDKDGVGAAYLICEMFSYYAAHGVRLTEKLEELYAAYGYCLNTLHSYEFAGSVGWENMQAVMRRFRSGVRELGGRSVLSLVDYAPGQADLPPSDVLRFQLAGGAALVVRPSGTEPKLKLYVSVCAQSPDEAKEAEAAIVRAAEARLK